LSIGIVPPSSPSIHAAPEWQSQALCANKTHLFFDQPGEREGRRTRREAIAKSYCANCPIAAACKQAGRLNREHGIWGGETDEERARAGYPPRNISRRGVAAAARAGERAQLISEADPAEQDQQASYG